MILPSSIAYINGGAFQGCSGFTGHLILPAYCTIYKDAFSGCDGFTTVTLSPGVKIDHTNAFGNNSDNMFPSVTTVYLLTEEKLPNKISKWINGLGNNVIRPEDQLATPTISPDGDLYTNAITSGVVINSNTDGATIYYTIDDGINWLTATSGNTLKKDGNTLLINEPTIIKFYTKKDNKQSPTIFSEYTFKAAEPVLSTESELPFEGEIEIAITCETANATIYYTTDGNAPTTSSSVYNKSITIEPNERTVINAIAVKNGTDPEFEWLDSELASGTYNDNTMVIFIKDGVWSNPNNWSSGYVPNKDGRAAIGANLRIADGEKAEIAYITNVPSTYYTAGTITIEDGGQLVAGEAAIENVKVEKEIAGHGGTNGGWYAISSPMANEINNTYYNNLISSTADNYDLYYYNESKWYWYNFKESTNNFKYFNLGQGYLYANSNDNTIISVGVPRMKNTVSVSVSNTTYTPSNNTQNYNLKGFNLIGNPFTFDIGWDAISSNDILADGYYTLGTDGTWTVKTSNSEPIKVGMGILVQANTSGTINIKDTPFIQTKQIEQDSKRGMSVKESLAITVSNEKYTDVAYINFSNDSENGLRKIAHMNEDIQMVYVPVKGVNYAIANVDENASEVPVSFETYVMGKYTISVKANNIHDEVYLLDKVTGEKIDILNEDYTFVTTSSGKADRFSLLFVNNDEEDSDTTNPTFAYLNNGEIIISDIEGSGDVKIYDVMGRLVFAENANGSAKISTESFTNGIYIINLIDGDGIKTQKIAIRK